MAMNDEQISDLIYQCRKAKTGVEMVESQDQKTYVNIVVSNRNQIAQIIRDLRMHFGFPRIERLNMPIVQADVVKPNNCLLLRDLSLLYKMYNFKTNLNQERLNSIQQFRDNTFVLKSLCFEIKGHRRA